MKMRDRDILRRIPLAPKMLLLTVLVGGIVWAVMDYVQTNKLRSMFENDLAGRLSRQAQEDRLRFDNHFASYQQAAELIISQKSFHDYVNDKTSFPDSASGVKRHTELPCWMPDAPVMRKFVPIHYAFLIDARGAVREVWMGLPEPPSRSLLQPSDLVKKLSHNQSFMTTVDGAPFLLTAESISGQKGGPLVTLMIAARINDDFLAASQGLTSTERIVALAGGEGPKIIASNRPDLMPAGTQLDELKRRYLITGKSFFDWGASDLVLQFTSFIPRGEFEKLGQSILNAERLQRLILSFLLILSFALIMYWITGHIQQLTLNIADLSRNIPDIGPLNVRKGDQLSILEDHFYNFTRELVKYNEKLKAEINERRQAEDSLKVSEEKYRSVIDNIGIGVSLISSDMEILSMNKQMKIWFPNISEASKAICFRSFNDPPRTDICPYCPVRKTLNDGQVHEAITETPSADGTRNYRVVASPLRDMDGKVIAAIEMVEDYTERKLYEDELSKSREQLRAFAAHLQTARENERTMIAREIHDELAQALTVLKIDVSELASDFDRLDPETAQQFLARTGAMAGFLDDTIEVVHRISMELRPSILDDIGLTAAIEWQTHEFQKRTRIQCDLKQDVTARIDRDLCTALFRVFQEALNNVLRHANATKVKIELFEKDGNVILVVEDNGCGIAEDRVSDTRSLGLLGMRERIEMFGGKISFKGIKYKGTTVTVSVPAG